MEVTHNHSPAPLLSITEIGEAFAPYQDRFPPILSLAQAAEIARIKPSMLTRLVSEGKFRNCVRRGKPLLFWRDRFIMGLFNGKG
jgi:hypothetical protein